MTVDWNNRPHLLPSLRSMCVAGCLFFGGSEAYVDSADHALDRACHTGAYLGFGRQMKTPVSSDTDRTIRGLAMCRPADAQQDRCCSVGSLSSAEAWHGQRSMTALSHYQRSFLGLVSLRWKSEATEVLGLRQSRPAPAIHSSIFDNARRLFDDSSATGADRKATFGDSRRQNPGAQSKPIAATYIARDISHCRTTQHKAQLNKRLQHTAIGQRLLQPIPVA